MDPIRSGLKYRSDSVRQSMPVALRLGCECAVDGPAEGGWWGATGRVSSASAFRSSLELTSIAHNIARDDCHLSLSSASLGDPRPRIGSLAHAQALV